MYAPDFYDFSYRYDFSDFFGQTVTLWPGYTVNMVQLISTVIATVLSLVCYVFLAVALYSIARKQGIKPAGLAWVPILNFYLLGKVSDVVSSAEGKRTHRRISLVTFHAILRGLSLGLSVYLPAILNFIFQFMIYYNYYQPHPGSSPDSVAPVVAPVLVTIFSVLLIGTLSILYFVFLMRAVYVILKDRSPRNCALMIILCIFVSYAIGPCLFAVRNNPSISEAQLNYLRQQREMQAEAAARYQREQMEKAAQQSQPEESTENQNDIPNE